ASSESSGTDVFNYYNDFSSAPTINLNNGTSENYTPSMPVTEFNVAGTATDIDFIVRTFSRHTFGNGFIGFGWTDFGAGTANQNAVYRHIGIAIDNDSDHVGIRGELVRWDYMRDDSAENN